MEIPPLLSGKAQALRKCVIQTSDNNHAVNHKLSWRQTSSLALPLVISNCLGHSADLFFPCHTWSLPWLISSRHWLQFPSTSWEHPHLHLRLRSLAWAPQGYASLLIWHCCVGRRRTPSTLSKIKALLSKAMPAPSFPAQHRVPLCTFLDPRLGKHPCTFLIPHSFTSSPHAVHHQSLPASSTKSGVTFHSSGL